MKIELNNQLYKHYNKNKIYDVKKKKLSNDDFLQSDKDNNNAQNRPAQAISFGGSVGSLGQKALDGFVNSKTINNLINSVYDNEVKFTAIYALLIAGILKPMAVLHMPGSEEKDKQIVATKNFLQAFLGSFMSFTIGGQYIKKSVDIIKNNLKLVKLDDKGNITSVKSDEYPALELAKSILGKEHNTLKNKFQNAKNLSNDFNGIKKATTFIKTMFKNADYTPSYDEIASKAAKLTSDFEKNHLQIFQKNTAFATQLKNQTKNLKSNTLYSDAFEILWKNSTGAATSILKAIISSALLPTVMALLFAKKNKQKEQQRLEELKRNSLALEMNSNFKQENEKFKNLLNSNQNPSSSRPISFNGNILSSAIDGTAGLIEKAGMSYVGSNLTKLLAHAKKPSARMADLESFGVTAYWLINTKHSKHIDPSQKLGLNIHTALVTIVSSSCAFLIDWALDGVIKKATNLYGDNIKKAIQAVKKEHSDIINSTKTIHEQNIPDIVKMALNDVCKKHLNEANVNTKEIIENLKQSNAIKNSLKNNIELNEDLINQTIENLKNTEPIRTTIVNTCKNILDSTNVAKRLSQINLNDAKMVEKEINSLCGEYSKKLNKFKSLTIFTFVVRFLVPVLMVPVGGKLKLRVVEKQKAKQAQKNNQNTPKI